MSVLFSVTVSFTLCFFVLLVISWLVDLVGAMFCLSCASYCFSCVM